MEFEVGCLGLYVLRDYCKLKIAYEDYYRCHQTSTSSRLTFAMTRIETVPHHVGSKTKDQREKWEQAMSNRQELACFIDMEITPLLLSFRGLPRTS